MITRVALALIYVHVAIDSRVASAAVTLKVPGSREVSAGGPVLTGRSCDAVVRRGLAFVSRESRGAFAGRGGVLVFGDRGAGAAVLAWDPEAIVGSGTTE